MGTYRKLVKTMAQINRISRSLTRLSKPATSLYNRSLSISAIKQSETHTGQNWEADDYRNVRWAINLIKETPPVPVKGRIAVCEGGPSEALGHPKIYINLDEPGNHSCIYCGLRFFKEGH